MNVRFIHISDVHLIENWPEEQGRLLVQFVEDLKRYGDGKFENYALITGDIVQAGSRIEFYDEFDRRFGRAFDEIGIPPERRIIIPGNHDVCRDVLTKNKAEFLSDAEMAGIDATSGVLGGTSIDRYVAKFENYYAFSTSFSALCPGPEAIGGYGLSIVPGIEVYCLNTAITSFGGLEGKVDEGSLLVDFRSLENWIQRDSASTSIKILAAHHPVADLRPDHRDRLSRIIDSSFDIAVFGHRHDPDSRAHVYGDNGHIEVYAPALFTSEAAVQRGYSVIEVSGDQDVVKIGYRTYSNRLKFVQGTVFSNTDDGVVAHKLSPQRTQKSGIPNTEVRKRLEQDLEEALEAIPNTQSFWVEPQVSRVPEYDAEAHKATIVPASSLLNDEPGVTIRAPAQFGLSSLGRYLSLISYKNNPSAFFLYVDAVDFPNDTKGQSRYLKRRCEYLGISVESVSGLILDNCGVSGLRMERKLSELSEFYARDRLILLESTDDGRNLGFADGNDSNLERPVYYLWGLLRSDIRQVVRHFVEDDSLDEDLVLNRVMSDFKELNIYRTPINAMALTKIAISQMDLSPVNRTEVIEKWLNILFSEFHKGSKYSTIPDSKDAQYALGHFCSRLMRENTNVFSKEMFFATITKYCSDRYIDMESDVLFQCLFESKIIVKHGADYTFRFMYWWNFFVAHGMFNDELFRQHMLNDKKYMSHPEIIEFYTGIDRRREDLLDVILEDLRDLLCSFEARTGIDAEFDPMGSLTWEPTEQGIENFRDRIEEEVKESSLPTSVKDSIADKEFDKSAAYQQEMRTFIQDSFIACVKMAQAASCAVRNSEHVVGSVKVEILKEIARLWFKQAQVMAIVSPFLAKSRYASFEGFGLVLSEKFFETKDFERRWHRILAALPYNIALYSVGYIYSPKIVPLYDAVQKEGFPDLAKCIAVQHLIMHRPRNWREKVTAYLLSQKKNSIYLLSVLDMLKYQLRYGFLSKGDADDIRKLVRYTVDKHFGKKSKAILR